MVDMVRSAEAEAENCQDYAFAVAQSDGSDAARLAQHETCGRLRGIPCPARSRMHACQHATSVQRPAWSARQRASRRPTRNPWVCVWPWHLELNGKPDEHLVHVEHGGRGVHSGDGVCRSLPELRRPDRVYAEAGADLVDASRHREPVSVSQQAATCAAATLQSGCSIASAAA